MDVSRVRIGMLAPKHNFVVRKLVFRSKGFTVTFTYVAGQMDSSNVLSVVKTAKNSVQMHYLSHTSVDFPNIV